jgi:hypothetical protein
MKALIFLILMALVIFGMIWSMRKSRAKADAARHESLNRLKKERQKVLTPQQYATWPVIITPLKRDGDTSNADLPPEPTMTAVEYEPPGRASA